MMTGLTQHSATNPLFTLLLLIVAVAVLIPINAEANGTDASYRVLSHEISITVDVEQRASSGKDTLTLRDTERNEPDPILTLYLRDNSRIDSIQYNGVDAAYRTVHKRKARLTEINIDIDAATRLGKEAGGEKELVIEFHGTYESIETARGRIRRGVAYVDDGMVGPEGIYFPSNGFWYPREENELALFKAEFRVPGNLTTVSEGRRVSAKKWGAESIEQWETTKTIDGLNLVAAPFHITKEVYKGINLYTFFFKDEPELTRTYLDKTRYYIDLYTEMLGPYPFSKFAVVENFLPTGYGMPSFTLLGSHVLRLPFIPDTSLGHEIAHSWWGNSVFIDDTYGNWSEALTTYTADYLYERIKGKKEARDFRISKLRGYKNFAPDSPISLGNFKDATSTASRAIGYNKGSMLFGMLEEELGTEAFGKGLKLFYNNNRFKSATWHDLRQAFESVAENDLAWFFNQWVAQPGAPRLSIYDVTIDSGKRGGYRVGLTIEQTRPAYRLLLPVVITTEDGAKRSTKVKVEKTRQTVFIEVDERPATIEVDPEYTLFRLLDDSEVPPSFSVFFGDKQGVIISPDSQGSDNHSSKYGEIAKLLSRDYGQKIISYADADIEEYASERSILILGDSDENPVNKLVWQYLEEIVQFDEKSVTVAGKSYSKDGTVVGVAVKNPANPSKNICLLFGYGDNEDIIKNAKRLRYFSTKSYVVFTGSGSPVKGLTPGDKRLRYEFPDKESD
ncbi:MAG: hypothetical protein IME99_01380 [Proteobacteria bacterium]|nr:hypothetical protein [Pseudomonadota bacterium]